MRPDANRACTKPLLPLVCLLCAALALPGAAFADPVVQKGGTVYNSHNNLNDEVFVGSKASAPGKTADEAAAEAYGGAVYFTDGGSILSSTFSSNSAIATGGTAQGGTAYAYANADAYAFGGGAFFNNGGTVKDSVFFNNSVTATAPGRVVQNGVARAPEAEAKGGAMFVNTNGVRGDPILTLTATANGRTVISGNTANGAPSGIHFGRGGDLDFFTGYFTASSSAATFKVQA